MTKPLKIRKIGTSLGLVLPKALEGLDLDAARAAAQAARAAE